MKALRGGLSLVRRVLDFLNPRGASSFMGRSDRVTMYDSTQRQHSAFPFAFFWFALPAAVLVLSAWFQHHR